MQKPCSFVYVLLLKSCITYSEVVFFPELKTIISKIIKNDQWDLQNLINYFTVICGLPILIKSNVNVMNLEKKANNTQTR